MTPLEQLVAWIEEAKGLGVGEPDAMALATVGEGGRPAVRFVLCRGIDDRGVRFFTNYESRKGRELAANPAASAVFHWAATGHQVRIDGRVEVVAPGESDAYFGSRARASQLAASVSPQSRPIASLDDLRREAAALDASLAGTPVPRPANWGGYRIVADAVELWSTGPARLHDRVRYERSGSAWIAQRLAP